MSHTKQEIDTDNNIAQMTIYGITIVSHYATTVAP